MKILTGTDKEKINIYSNNNQNEIFLEKLGNSERDFLEENSKLDDSNLSFVGEIKKVKIFLLN